MSLKLPSFSSQAGPIGLEVSLEYVHMVQLHVQNGQARLRSYSSQPMSATFENLLAEPQEFAKVISAGLKRGNFKGKQVITSMPSTMTRLMSVNYELNNGQSDDQAVTKLLHDRIGDELADFVVDFMPINQDHRVTERAALIAMCRRDSVTAFLDTLGMCGLQPKALEIGPVAIKRLVDSIQHRQLNNSALILNCGRARSYLTLVANRQLLSDDEVEFGERSVLARVCDELDVDTKVAKQLIQSTNLGDKKPDDNTRALIEIIRPELDDLVREIERGLIYATTESRGQDDTTVYLMGSLARWPGADKLLSRLLNHPIKTIPNPLQPFLSKTQLAEPQWAEGAEHGRPELAVAAGLALRDFYHG